MKIWCYNTKFKSLTVLITTLILSTPVFVDATSVNISPIKSYNLVNQDEAFLPEWSIGDYWEYENADFYIGDIILDVISLEFNIKDMEVKVTDIKDDKDEYILDLNGKTEKIIYNKIPILDSYKGATAYLNGISHIQKSTLAIKDFNLHLSVFLVDREVFNIDFIMEFNSSFDFFQFPIITTKQNPWNANTNYTLTLIVNGDTYLEIQDQPVEDILSFIEIDNICGFDSLLINGSIGKISELWYAPLAGFLVNVSEEINLKAEIGGIEVEYAKMICNLNLKDTNYDPENVENRPSIPLSPLGPPTGKAGVSHEYKTSTIDPNNDPVYYQFDWGDGTVSNWLGPYASGEEISGFHTWQDKGRYEIKVKAKDENGLKTAWSDKTITSMPKIKQTNSNLWLRIQNIFPQLFTLLQSFMLD